MNSQSNIIISNAILKDSMITFPVASLSGNNYNTGKPFIIFAVCVLCAYCWHIMKNLL